MRARTTLGAAAVVAVLAVPVLGAFRQPGAPMEEGKLLAAAELVLSGEVPHRDFEHFYGPADVWAVAGAMATAGHSVGAERAVGVGYFALLVAAVFVLVRVAAGVVPAVVAATACGWVMVPFGVHAYSWTAGLAFLLAAVAVVLARAEVGTTRAAVAGTLAGLALLYRADLVVAVACLAALVWPMLDRRGRQAGAIGGAIAAGVPYLVHLATAGWAATWRGMVTDTLFRLRDGRSLPVPPPAGGLTAWLDLSAPEPSPSPLLPDPARVTQLRAFFWITAGAIVLAAALGAWALARHRGRRDAAWLACTGAVAVTIAPQMLQRADATHVRFVAAAVVPLAAVAVAVAWRLVDERAPRSAAATEGVVLAMVALLLAAPFYTARLAATTARRGLGLLDTARVGIDGRAFPVVDPLRADAAALLELVDERVPRGAGLRVFVGPQDLRLANYSDAFLYFVLGERVRPASFYLESNPGIANGPTSHLASDLRRADVLVLSNEYDNWDEPNASRRPGSDAPGRVVEELFCTAGEAGRYRLLLRCQ